MPDRAVAITTSSLFTFRAIPPQVPTRTKVSAPSACSSSMAMTAEGPPIPVEQTLTLSPRSVPVYVVNSRLEATLTGWSK